MRKGRGCTKWIGVTLSVLAALACVVLGVYAVLCVRQQQAQAQDEPPSVNITEPASGALVSADSHLAVSASAFGGVPIARVELWLDGELVDTEESSLAGGISPFDVSFDLLVPQGQHTLVVRAVNAEGLTVDSWPVTVSGVEESLSPGTISTPEATVGPVAPTTESQEPVEISLMAKEGRVPGDTPIVLRFGWETDTREQVADFLSSVELVVSLDGELVPDAGEYWSEIEESGDRDQNGEANYQTFWLFPVGVLTSGTHQVESELRFQRPVTDGFDSDGDGVPDEYSEPIRFSLQIVVGE
jgi:hypothetical protein